MKLPNKEVESSSINKLPIIKTLMIHTLRNYYYMQLEIFLGFGVLQGLN